MLGVKVLINIQTQYALLFCFQIWEAVDNKTGYLTRNSLYKALALVALAQQGKTINDKILETYSDQGELIILDSYLMFCNILNCNCNYFHVSDCVLSCNCLYQLCVTWLFMKVTVNVCFRTSKTYFG